MRLKNCLLAFVLSLGVLCSGWAATDYTVTVTNGIKVLPARWHEATTGNAWAVSTTYLQGATVRRGSVTYMAVNAGTSGIAEASAPSHGMGVSQPAAQSIRWLAVERQDRKAIMIQQNATTGSVSITRSAGSGLGTGTVIGANSTYSDASCWQGEVWVNATNATINVSDW